MLQKDGDVVDLKLVPYKVLISMEQHHERRKHAQKQFSQLGMAVDWKIPTRIEHIPWAALPASYEHSAKYTSQAVTLLDVLEEVERRKVDSFMLLEDDVIFHSDIVNLLPKIRVPRDWRFIYIGGRNNGIKEEVAPGLVRSTFVSDLHAVIIRSSMIDALRMALLDPAIDSHLADLRIASLHKKYPAYLCRPNLAWQSVHGNGSPDGKATSNYNEDGSVVQDEGD